MIFTLELVPTERRCVLFSGVVDACRGCSSIHWILLVLVGVAIIIWQC